MHSLMLQDERIPNERDISNHIRFQLDFESRSSTVQSAVPARPGFQDLAPVSLDQTRQRSQRGTSKRLCEHDRVPVKKLSEHKDWSRERFVGAGARCGSRTGRDRAGSQGWRRQGRMSWIHMQLVFTWLYKESTSREIAFR